MEMIKSDGNGSSLGRIGGDRRWAGENRKRKLSIFGDEDPTRQRSDKDEYAERRLSNNFPRSLGQP